MSAVMPIECETYGWDSPECNYQIAGWAIDGPALNGYEIASLYHCGYVGNSRESSAYRYDGNTLTVIEVVQCVTFPCEPMVAYYDVTAPHDEQTAPTNTLAVILGLQGLIQNDKEGGASTAVAYPCEIDPDPVPREGSDYMYECLAAGFSEVECYGEKPLGAFTQDEIERLLRGERIAPVLAMGDSELVYDAARNVLIVYRPGTDVVLAEQSLDDPKLDTRFQVFKEAAQSSGGTGLIIAAVAGLLLLSNRR